MKVLVALDRSPQSELVLERAVEIAKWRGAGLTVLTVAEEILDYSEGTNFSVGDVIQKQAQAFLDEIKPKALAMGVDVRTAMVSSHSAAEAILALAEEDGAELIVMGSQGKSAIGRFLIGSVATKVVAHAKCSVLVVR